MKRWAVTINYLNDDESQEQAIGLFVGSNDEFHDSLKLAKEMEQERYVETVIVTEITSEVLDTLRVILDGERTPNFPLDFLMADQDGNLDEEDLFI